MLVRASHFLERLSFPVEEHDADSVVPQTVPNAVVDHIQNFVECFGGIDSSTNLQEQGKVRLAPANISVQRVDPLCPLFE